MRRTVAALFAVLILLIVVAPLPAAAREIIVRKGETLAIIAGRELGSVYRWEEIARLNGIDDPRRLREGQRLLLPDGDELAEASAASAAEHLPGMPSVARIDGAVRYRKSANAPWTDLRRAEPAVGGCWIMTANTGRAEFAIDANRIAVGPFTIVQVQRLDPASLAAQIAVILGEVEIRASGSPVAVQDAAGTLRLTDGVARVAKDDKGRIKIGVQSGSADFTAADGTGIRLPAGAGVSCRPGEKPVTTAAPQPATAAGATLALRQPVDGSVVSDKDVLFEWNDAGTGARAWRFLLRPDDRTQPSIEEVVEKTRLLVRNVPEGKYTWQVTPQGARVPVSPARAEIVVQRGSFPAPQPQKPVASPVAAAAPEIEVSLSLLPGGGARIYGHTVSGATLTIGGTEVRVMDDGTFDHEIPAIDGLAILGVEARQGPDGAVTRRAVAVPGHAAGEEIEAVALVGDGAVTLDGKTLPAKLQLVEGRNRFDWAWTVDGARIDQGRADILLDRTPPEILAVRSSSDRINSGDPLTIIVTARDRGNGLGPASAATMTLTGPKGFTETIKASERTANGEYIFNVATPATLDDGILKVSSLEISDADGNSTVISSQGMATETVSPAGRTRRLFVNVFMLGIGIAIGAAL